MGLDEKSSKSHKSFLEKNTKELDFSCNVKGGDVNFEKIKKLNEVKEIIL